ncbi:MAG: hypothetical protein KBD43_14245 [Saprospiraceae bacterium]|nr:hypothetical protein [Saprospiraceae bacterium]
MKVFSLIVALFAFIVSAIGGDWTAPVVQTFPDRETAEKVVRRLMLGTTERPQPKLAGVGDTLPTQLHMFGDPTLVRDWIVGKGHGFGVLNVTVGIGYGTADGEWSETTTTKATYGYSSYSEAMEDAKIGFAQVMVTQASRTNYPGGTVYAMYIVSYFNDDPGIAQDSIGVFVANPIGEMGTVTADAYVAQLAPQKPFLSENVTIRVPSLVLVYTEVAFVGEKYETNRIEWSRWSVREGPKLSSGWPAKLPERSSQGFLIVKGIVARGEHPARLAIETSTGERRVFTQFGDDLLQPIKLGIGKDGVIRINECPRGANIDVHLSVDGRNWSSVATIWSTDRIVSFPSELVAGPMVLVKTSQW